MNVAQSLKSLSAYPTPPATLQDIAESVGLQVSAEVTQEMRSSKEFRRAQAKTYIFLADAPNVSQGGITYSFSEEERKRLRTRGEAILDEIGDSSEENGVAYGYQSDEL
jgi:hypothetical protein